MKYLIFLLLASCAQSNLHSNTAFKQARGPEIGAVEQMGVINGETYFVDSSGNYIKSKNMVNWE